MIKNKFQVQERRGVVKHNVVYLIIFVFSSLFSACSNNTQAELKREVNIRCSIVPATTGYLECSVFFEGPGGESVSGALVIVSNSLNQITQLTYDHNNCFYSTRIEENTDTYIFEIRSILLNEPRLIYVPYSTIAKSPVVTVFRDSDGSSVLNGEELKPDLPVQIAWTGSGSNVSYQLVVKSIFYTCYAITTNAETIIIPENTIPPGSYTLAISAQKIYGDPSFKNEDYYSFSNSSAAGIIFDVK